MTKFIRVGPGRVMNVTGIYDAQVVEVAEQEPKAFALQLRFLDALGEPDMEKGLPALISPPTYITGAVEELSAILDQMAPAPAPVAEPVPDDQRREFPETGKRRAAPKRRAANK